MLNSVLTNMHTELVLLWTYNETYTKTERFRSNELLTVACTKYLNGDDMQNTSLIPDK